MLMSGVAATARGNGIESYRAIANQQDIGNDSPGPADFPAETQSDALVAAALLLVGIAVVGLILILLILLWGVRVRRVMRTRLPPTGRQDELWYLRPNKEHPADGDDPGKPTSDGSGTAAE